LDICLIPKKFHMGPNYKNIEIYHIVGRSKCGFTGEATFFLALKMLEYCEGIDRLPKMRTAWR